MEVPVLLVDLEVIRATLNSAYNDNTVIDLHEQYRKLSNRPQGSPMTKALSGALTKIDAYIQSAEEEEDGR